MHIYKSQRESPINRALMHQIPLHQMWHASWQIYIYIDNGHSPMADGSPSSTADALNTAKPNLSHIMADLYIYRQIHIYPWQMDPLLVNRE